jgi:hypothetical protein
MRLFVLVIALFCGLGLQNAHASGANWMFLGISSVDMSTDYYDANSIARDSGFISGPTVRVTIFVEYPATHPDLKSEQCLMQFYCKNKTFLTLERHQIKKNGSTNNITKQSWVDDVPPNTIAEKLFKIVCR